MIGPLLFLIYINDLPSSVNSKVRLFADDCVIYRTISSETDRQSLQSDLVSLTSWCTAWQMTLNPSKTKLMCFTKKASRIPTSYLLNNTSVELTTSYKYLGVNIQSDLSWHHHINVTLASANRSLGFLKRNLKHTPSHLRKLAYITLIRPKIEYASAIWDPDQDYIIENIEALQNRAVRFIFSDYSRHTSVTSLKLRAELELLSRRRKIARLSLLHKLYHHTSLHEDFRPPPAIFPRRDHPFKIERFPCRTFHYARSFIPRTITEWNDLPSNIATVTDITEFQNLLNMSASV